MTLEELKYFVDNAINHYGKDLKVMVYNNKKEEWEEAEFIVYGKNNAFFISTE